jgi:hypothetical protein
MTTAADDNHRWRAFRAGTLPCSSCGLAVTDTDPERVEVLELVTGQGRGIVDDSNVVREWWNTADMPVSRCDDCQMIHLSAADLIVANPSVRGMIGDPGLALLRVEMSLLALDVLGTTDARVIDKLTRSPQALRALIAALARPGGAARWAASARAQRWPHSLSTPPSSTRWSHVSPAQRHALNEARVTLFVERTAKPVPVLAPSEGDLPTGCMLCGTGTVYALPKQADSVWVEMSADPEAIGGRPAPDTLDGVLCPMCDRAVDAAGGIGFTAMQRSVLDHLGVAPHLRGIAEFGTIGWAVTGRAPNAQPWAHLDLSAVREEVGTLAGPHPVGDYQPLVPTTMLAQFARR